MFCYFQFLTHSFYSDFRIYMMSIHACHLINRDRNYKTIMLIKPIPLFMISKKLLCIKVKPFFLFLDGMEQAMTPFPLWAEVPRVRPPSLTLPLYGDPDVRPPLSPPPPVWGPWCKTTNLQRQLFVFNPIWTSLIESRQVSSDLDKFNPVNTKCFPFVWTTTILDIWVDYYVFSTISLKKQEKNLSF